MKSILNIDTSMDVAFVTIARDGVPMATKTNINQKEHAGFVHNAIKELMQDTGIRLDELSAVAVTEGPGSYTGLRVGMSTAIGLCYALNKPFIKISTLKMIAYDMYRSVQSSDSLYCPMVDARRMEVYTALYDFELNIRLQPQAMILDSDSFQQELQKQKICFSGNGSLKFIDIPNSSNAAFLSLNDLPLSLSELSNNAFLNSNFSKLTDAEPNYIKNYVNS